MKLLELHILQSFPVSCLNRDDLGSPKTTYFGGYERARVSSQCWKRAIREFVQKSSSYSFNGIRTKFLFDRFLDEFIKCFQKGQLENKKLLEDIELLAEKTASFFCKGDKKGTEALVFLCPREIDHIVRKFCELGLDALLEKKDLSKPAKKVLESLKAKIFDAIDIALFGRMIANCPSLQVEGAAMFNHAISTHEINKEQDFYTALDDNPQPDTIGASMMGILECNSAVYYRYAGVNLDLLFDNLSNKCIDEKIKKGILKDFIKATLLAIPKARQNSMNANVPPHFVLGIVREQGHPLQLVNAFESPISINSSGDSILNGSVKKLQEYYKALKAAWNLQDSLIVFDPFASDSTQTKLSFEEFCKELCDNSVNSIISAKADSHCGANA